MALTIKRTDLINKLIDYDLERMDEESFVLILWDGCKGYNSTDDETLKELYLEAFSEEFEEDETTADITIEKESDRP